MTEVDYQVALLLQHKYEQENKDAKLAKELQEKFEKESKAKERNKSNSTELSDSMIARSLQEQFKTELQVERHGQNLVYEAGSSSNSRQATKSLTDPSWEVIDPTPDIHNLFIVFNERFFWNQLGSVCVSWSKRMTTCAGICYYQGRGGMCTINLSELLLKLRPRKDLVETLLHEMIHAYLFITNNNRDRDGHGPEFHKHMKRINDEAGTNITVYHNFHDEVNLYKQHWWRCNGVCQTRQPYFGLVRRATNRAPGPNDFWWEDHSKRCSGKFIKVKEPEKPPKVPKKKSEPKPTNSADIRTFFPTVGNIKTISDSNQSNPRSNNTSSKSNIFGFGNLNDGGKTTSFNFKSNTTNQTGSSGSSNDYSVVRNHWANKFSDPNNSSPKSILKSNRSNFSVPANQTQPGFSKNNNVASGSNVQNYFSSSIDASNSTDAVRNKKKRVSFDLALRFEKIPRLIFAKCPVCSKQIPEQDINIHLDGCLEISPVKECHICGLTAVTDNFQSHVMDCIQSFDNKENDGNNPKDENAKKCDFCRRMIAEDIFKVHVQDCLTSFYDKMEGRIRRTKSEPQPSTSAIVVDAVEDSEEVDCLACNKKIVKRELNNHLDDCMSLSNIFEKENEPQDSDSDGGMLYNCPCCMGLFDDLEMNDHIDICLGLVVDDD